MNQQIIQADDAINALPRPKLMRLKGWAGGDLAGDYGIAQGILDVSLQDTAEWLFANGTASRE